MSRPIVYLDRPIKTKLIRWLQRMQRIGKRAVVVRHRVLADKLGCSESTVKRVVRELEAEGHILKQHIRRPSKGGFLCCYRVRTDVIYRTASFARQADDLLPTGSEIAIQGHLRQRKKVVSRGLDKNSNESSRNGSIHRRASMKDLMLMARVVGIEDSQRGYLWQAARKYGVYEAWEALREAVNAGYPRDRLTRIVWGILRKWYPDQRKEAMAW